MVTVAMISDLGEHEACARSANSNGYCSATYDAFQLLFGAGAPKGAPQSLDYEGVTITVVVGCSGVGVPPNAFSVS